MCNLSKGIEDRGIEKGIEKGMERGLEQGLEHGLLSSIRNLMETMSSVHPVRRWMPLRFPGKTGNGMNSF